MATEAQMRLIGRLLAERDTSLLSASLLGIANEVSLGSRNETPSAVSALIRILKELPYYTVNKEWY